MREGRATAPLPDYTKFTVLLDDAADQPSLGFDVYADAFSQMIQHSRPQFAIGIFGDWGSGKTTLMRAIRARVVKQPATLPIWFNAWRYEKEEHLIVPLLDHLREGLLDWKAIKDDTRRPAWATRSASLFGRAGRRILHGLTIEGGVPGAKAKLDFGAVVDAPTTTDGPASFYHAAFEDMRAATAEFSKGKNDARIVVFVDDLDRCLPANALDVLESMKLFFDQTGFVFVVGLDRSVIERSIEAKYEGGSPSRAPVVIERVAPEASSATPLRGRTDRAAPISGAEYIKKIFQVPFTLPRVGTGQLHELLDTLRANRTVPTEQGDDLTITVRPHIAYLTDRDTLNPREVKRLINAYTLQMKLLYPRLGPDTSADTVLAIQLIGFREDWARINAVLLGDPDAFKTELKQLLEDEDDGPPVLGEDAEPVPSVFLAYIRSTASALLDQPSLIPYVTSAEQTRTIGSDSLPAQQAVRRLRRILGAVADGSQKVRDPSVLMTELRALLTSLDRSADAAPDLHERLMDRARYLESEFGRLTPADVNTTIEASHTAWREALNAISDGLNEVRRRAAIGIS